MSKDGKNKKQKIGDLNGVSVILEDAQEDGQAVSPFSSENLTTGVFGGVPLSQSSRKPPTDFLDTIHPE